ncbi:hypothetical protein P692DRAFT_20859854, partial [Suillus brevipes Sb2]
MLHSLDPLNNLPFSFVGRGRQKAHLLQEIDSAAPKIDTQPATSDSIDFSLIGTASDGKLLPSHPFSGFMMMSKRYAVIGRKLKADPRNPQRIHSQKLQYHFSQAYSPAKAPAQLIYFDRS